MGWTGSSVLSSKLICLSVSFCGDFIFHHHPLYLSRSLKGGVSDFCYPLLTFEITKTNTPLPQKGLAPILIAPPHTYVQQRLVLWNKAKLNIISDAVYTKDVTIPFFQIRSRKFWVSANSNLIPAQFFFFLNQCRISILLCHSFVC